MALFDSAPDHGVAPGPSRSPARRSRPRRPLPGGPANPGASDTPPGAGVRSLFCLDLRSLAVAWSKQSVEDVRDQYRGGRLTSLLATMDLDPRRSLRHLGRSLHPPAARALFDAFCEEAAEAVLLDVPLGALSLLLPVLCPQGQGESPYPKEEPYAWHEEPGGLVLLCDGPLQAEAATVALGQLQDPPPIPGVCPALLHYLLGEITYLLEAVRDRSRTLLIEA